MKKIIFILPLVSLVVVGCQFSNKQVSTNTNSTSTTNGVSVTSTKKFSDSADYKNAYLISGDSLDSAATEALTGFDFNKQTMADNSIQINLKAKESGYQDQRYTLQPGQQLYFVDRNLGDDRGKEGNQADDYGIIVDSRGYVINNQK